MLSSLLTEATPYPTQAHTYSSLSLTHYVKLAKEPYKRDDILQKRPTFLSASSSRALPRTHTLSLYICHTHILLSLSLCHDRTHRHTHTLLSLSLSHYITHKRTPLSLSLSHAPSNLHTHSARTRYHDWVRSQHLLFLTHTDTHTHTYTHTNLERERERELSLTITLSHTRIHTHIPARKTRFRHWVQ